MAAVVAVLTESLGESIKGFYKLRKAYLTLDSILQEERAYLASTGGSASSDDQINKSSTQSTASLGKTETEAEDDEDEFLDASEDVGTEKKIETYMGHLEIEGQQDTPSASAQLIDEGKGQDRLRRRPSMFSEGPDAEIFGGNAIDLFIHAGSNMCFGIILIVLSLIPPSFSTLARIAGFKGDRKQGLELLWQATKFQGNINGAFAGLVLLGYYNGMLGFSDILPSSGKGSYPKARCAALLQDFRRQYPEVCTP